MKTLLIADSDRTLLSALKKQARTSPYKIHTAHDGRECLKKCDALHPDLLIVDLMLPYLHGIEILKKVKTDPRTKETGVILSSGYPMIQNYHVAVREGVDYFLEKPYSPTHLFKLIRRYFEGTLRPDPFEGRESNISPKTQGYLPKLHSPNSYLKFWGTRGSNPVSGAEYLRFGGNTPCLEIRDGQHHLIIDAGTGIRPLGNHLHSDAPQTLHLVLSHTHLDHIQGFHFFSPIYHPNTKIHIYAPIGYEKRTREIFKEMLAYSYFPVRLDDIQAKITFSDLHEGVPFHVGSIEVNTHYAFHPGATLCFKIRCRNQLIGYATDNEFLMGYHGNPKTIGAHHPLLAPYQSQIQFFRGCDILIHEAQYTPKEYRKKVGWGHSSVSNATVLIKHCNIRDWLVTHHDPKHSDEDLLKKNQLHLDVLDDAGVRCRCRMVFDGLVLPL